MVAEMASSKVMASSKPRNSDLSSSSSSSASRSRSQRASTSSSSHPSISSTNPNLLSQQSGHIPYSVLNSSSPPTMTVDGILRNVYATPSFSDSTLLDAQITLIETPVALPTPPSVEGSSNNAAGGNDNSSQEMAVVVPQGSSGKTVDDVWREIVVGRKEMKKEPDEMMTLEDFLAKAGAMEVGGGGARGGGERGEEEEVEMALSERLSGGVYAFDGVPPPPPSSFQMLDKVEGSIVGFGSGVEVVAGGGGRGKSGRAPVLEPLDKAAQQRQRRMIKNRESAARSRERKQAYQVELESLAVRLEEENEQLLREKEVRNKERFKQIMEKVIPVEEKQRPPRVLRRVNSFQW
ncbi:hypothetical protein K2173_026820 [Erythroxylum novogranatense]|uniref:BZIP domain-containing protein n=1 Tax=Erythroxylum novogranatense TaxID=1862640 RepID=A0AAV8TXN0_9ROSI|nr:hypothetical protein K2173_026820 [Erythroxylum novogranatense]